MQEGMAADRTLIQEKVLRASGQPQYLSVLTVILLISLRVQDGRSHRNEAAEPCLHGSELSLSRRLFQGRLRRSGSEGC